MTDELKNQFGKVSGSDRGPQNINLKEDKSSVVVRFLPPMKSWRNTKNFGVFHRQHFGYSVRDPKDPTKLRIRPFLCIEERTREGLITVACPQCQKREEVEALIEDKQNLAISAAKNAGLSSEVAAAKAKEAVADETEWLQVHNRSSKWHLPVVQEDGTVGIFQVSNTAKKDIKILQDKVLASEGLDIFDVSSGAWIKITRHGTWTDTKYTFDLVSEVRVLEGGVRANVTKQAPLSQDTLQQVLDMPDLGTSSFFVRRLSVEQIRMLANCGGSPEEVESIMNLAGRADANPSPARALSQTVPAAAPTPAAPPVKVAPKPLPAPVVAVQNEIDDEEAQLLAQMEALRAKKAAAKQAVVAKSVVKPAPSPLADPGSLDDEDLDAFAARFPPPGKR